MKAFEPARSARGVILVLAFAMVAGGAAADPSPEQPIRVRQVTRAGRVYVSFAMPDGITDDVRNAIRSGLPTAFTYDVELRRGGLFWFDRTVQSAVISATVRYDNLSRKYHLTRTHDGRVEGTDVMADEAAVRLWLTAFERLPLFSTDRLEPNVEYTVRVRARATPRRNWGIWPFGAPDASGLAKFTFIQ